MQHITRDRGIKYKYVVGTVYKYKHCLWMSMNISYIFYSLHELNSGFPLKDGKCFFQLDGTFIFNTVKFISLFLAPPSLHWVYNFIKMDSSQ